MLEEDEFLRRVERKVLDPHTEVFHDQPFLTRHEAAKTSPAAAPHQISRAFANRRPH